MKNRMNSEQSSTSWAQKILRMLMVNLLWLVGSIPIITIGASTSAAYYAMLKVVRNEECGISEAYKKSFRQNLKQGIVVWIGYLLIGAILGYGFEQWFVAESLEKWMKIVLVSVSICYIFSLSYVFPFIARYQNNTRSLLMNAFAVSLRYVHRSILFTGMLAVYIVLVIKFPMFGGLVLIPGFGILCFVESFYLSGIFEQIEALGQEAAKKREELQKQIEREHIEQEEKEREEAILKAKKQAEEKALQEKKEKRKELHKAAAMSDPKNMTKAAALNRIVAATLEEEAVEEKEEQNSEQEV